ncbi:MAG: hypothetical protein R8G60_14800 [Roseovarius pacificus]|nr:hypothetical protein [Roseovarius pacificus]
MQSRDTLTACKAENEKLTEILLEYVERYGLTDKAREFFQQPADRAANTPRILNRFPR